MDYGDARAASRDDADSAGGDAGESLQTTDCCDGGKSACGCAGHSNDDAFYALACVLRRQRFGGVHFSPDCGELHAGSRAGGANGED